MAAESWWIALVSAPPSTRFQTASTGLLGSQRPLISCGWIISYSILSQSKNRQLCGLNLSLWCQYEENKSILLSPCYCLFHWDEVFTGKKMTIQFTAQRNYVAHCVTLDKDENIVFSQYIFPAMEMAGGGAEQLNLTREKGILLTEGQKQVRKESHRKKETKREGTSDGHSLRGESCSRREA